MYNENKKNKNREVLIVILFGLFLIFFPYNILDGKGVLGYILKTKEYDKLGVFISGITAPFAIFLLYLTYKSQKEELKSQKEEFKSSKQILEKQNKTLERQQFESKLFSLLDIYNEIMRSFSNKYSGKVFFSKIKTKLHINHTSPALQQFQMVVPSGKFDYYKYFQSHKDYLAHYFRVLYRIFKFIDEEENLEEKEKWFYAKMIRSQLSEGELFLLFYNCFTEYGENFQILCVK